jgi:hypothetical protein
MRTASPEEAEGRLVVAWVVEGSGAGEGAVPVHALTGGAEPRLHVEIPGAPARKPPEGRVSHARDDRSSGHADPEVMRCLEMISRMISLVPAPMPQFWMPQVQRATWFSAIMP